jgi:hypothetical protein
LHRMDSVLLSDRVYRIDTAQRFQSYLEVVPGNWTGWIITKTQSRIRSTCPRNDVSTVPI